MSDDLQELRKSAERLAKSHYANNPDSSLLADAERVGIWCLDELSRRDAEQADRGKPIEALWLDPWWFLENPDAREPTYSIPLDWADSYPDYQIHLCLTRNSDGSWYPRLEGYEAGKRSVWFPKLIETRGELYDILKALGWGGFES